MYFKNSTPKRDTYRFPGKLYISQYKAETFKPSSGKTIQEKLNNMFPLKV